MQESYKIYEENVLKIITRNIRIYREKKAYPQEFLAEKVGCSREHINRLENNKEDVSLKLLLKIAFVLEVEIKDLFK